MKDEFSDDIVFAQFLNYMKKALLHKKLNYKRKMNFRESNECSIHEMENELKIEETYSFKDYSTILTEKEERILRLHIFKKLTYKEISKLYHLQPESIRKIQYRAIQKLKRRIEEDENKD